MAVHTSLFRTGGFGLVTPPPSGRLVNEVLRLADVQEDLGGGRTRLRISAKRLRQRDVRAALGPDARRAAVVSVIFDEQEEQIVQVATDLSEPAEADAWMDEVEALYARRKAA